MKNILKKWNSKWFLLFLFTFFSLGMQAQWDEDTDGDGILDWVEGIIDSSPDGQNSSWMFEDGTIESAHYTTREELQADYDDYSINYGDESFISQIGTVFNANGTLASSYGSATEAMIGGSYFNGVNANGVIREYVGNLGYITNEVGDTQGAVNMNNLTLIGVYNYILPSGEVVTSSGAYDQDQDDDSSFSVVIIRTPPPAPVPIQIPIPPPPCNKLAKANLSDLVYDTENGVQKKGVLPNNVSIVPLTSLPQYVRDQVVFTDPNTGFNSALYRVDHGNGNIEYVYATAGTNDFSDVITDISQQQSMGTEQYYESVRNARVLQQWINSFGGVLSFTGHSLGGALANVNALATGLKATIYNPAGLSQGTIHNPDFDLNMDNIDDVTAYVVRGEPVDFLNNALGTPLSESVGTINYIGSPAVINYLSSSVVGDGAIGLHSMSSVKVFIDCTTN